MNMKLVTVARDICFLPKGRCGIDLKILVVFNRALLSKLGSLC